MQKISQFPLEDILPHIGKSVHKLRAKHCQEGYWKTYRIKLGGRRMMLLGRSQECICCGLKGKYFWLESNGYLSPHLNLYGIGPNDIEVMLTMDHIVPKARGGTTDSENIQLLCSRCNWSKQDIVCSVEELREHMQGVKSLRGSKMPNRQEEEDRTKRYKAALKEIQNPVGAMIKRAKAEGNELDNVWAIKLANDPSYLRQLAREALKD